jgi:hypothetical protein
MIHDFGVSEHVATLYQRGDASLAWAACGFIPTVVDWAVFLLGFVFISCWVTAGVKLLATLYICCLAFEDSLRFAHLLAQLALI